jgi:hypothetical protein
MIIVLAFFVAGILFIGHRYSENGRYQPFDYRTQHSPDGKTNYSPDRFEMLDTRTGEVIQTTR